METNYGRKARPSSPESLAGAVHLFLIDFDAWLAKIGQGADFAETGAGERLTRVREELTAYPYVALMPPGWNAEMRAIAAAVGRRKVPLRRRLRLAWLMLRQGGASE